MITRANRDAIKDGRRLVVLRPQKLLGDAGGDSTIIKAVAERDPEPDAP